MPPIQTVYNEYPAPGVAGRRANMEEWNTFTGLAEDVVSNPIGFAYPVEQGTAGEQVKLYDGTGRFRGITEADQTLGADTYPLGYNVPVCESGVIWVYASGNCTRGGAVGWNNTKKGYQNDATATVEIPDAEFDTDGIEGDVVRVRIRRIP